MRLGVHLRTAKGYKSALKRAAEIGCEAIQFFSSNPNSWKVSELSLDVAEAFRAGVAAEGFFPIVLHTPYLLNLASTNADIWEKSVSNLASALDRASLLGAQYIVTHIGSHGGAGFDIGADQVGRGVPAALAKSSGSATVLLEAGSGAGNTIGSTIEELAGLLSRLDSVSDRVGVCLDTAHLWGAGYDISSAAGIDDLLSKFDQLIGLHRLRVFHLNDTQKILGSHHDRHWHIGEGNVGLEAFAALANNSALADIAGILETPDMESGRDLDNLNVLKRLRTDGH